MQPLFLDTTIQVERIISEHSPDKKVKVDSLLGQFDYFLSCAYSRLEFKRVVIQNLALILDYICESGSFWEAFARATRVGRARRVSTLVNILAWLGHETDGEIEVTIGDSADKELAARAESYIRNGILFIWKRFDKSVNSVVDKAECRRAAEAPRRKRTGGFDVRIPESRCQDKECNNANFFRAHLPVLRKLRETLAAKLDKGERLSDELQEALEAINAAILSPDRLYNYQACLGLGDVWMHLECRAAGVSDFGTTNYKESQVLCPTLGLSMRLPPAEGD